MICEQVLFSLMQDQSSPSSPYILDMRKYTGDIVRYVGLVLLSCVVTETYVYMHRFRAVWHAVSS